MSNELIKKAYEKFNGVWPCGYSHLIERGSGEIIPAVVMEDGSFEYADSTRKVNTFVRGKKCTKSDFEEYGASLSNIAEGATHENLNADLANLYKNNDGIWLYFCAVNRDWVESANSEKWHIDNLTPLQPTKWLPEVGQECEYSLCETSWHTCVYKGKTTLSGLNMVELTHDHIEVLGSLAKFRPIKNEREKFVDECFKFANENGVHDEKLKDLLGVIFDKGEKLFNEK